MKKQVKKEIPYKVIVIMVVLSLLLLGASLIISNSVNKELKDNRDLIQDSSGGAQASVNLIINSPASAGTN